MFKIAIADQKEVDKVQDDVAGLQQDIQSLFDEIEGLTGEPGETGPPGEKGDDGYTLMLSNDSITIPAGAASAESSTHIVDVHGFKGKTQMPVNIGTITGTATGLSTSIYYNNSLNTYVRIVSSSSLTAVSGVINIPVTVDGVLFTKSVSWALSRTGAMGPQPDINAIFTHPGFMTRFQQETALLTHRIPLHLNLNLSYDTGVYYPTWYAFSEMHEPGYNASITLDVMEDDELVSTFTIGSQETFFTTLKPLAKYTMSIQKQHLFNEFTIKSLATLEFTTSSIIEPMTEILNCLVEITPYTTPDSYSIFPGTYDLNDYEIEITSFGSVNTQTDKYRGGVHVGGGKVVAIPYDAPYVLLIDAITQTTSTFGTFDNSHGKYFGGVYLGEGKVLAIPHNAPHPLLIDAIKKTTTKLTSFNLGPNQVEGAYAGGMYVGEHLVLATPYNARQPILIDTRNGFITPIKPDYPEDTIQRGEAYIGGVYIEEGQAVLPSHNEENTLVIQIHKRIYQKTGEYFGNTEEFSGAALVDPIGAYALPKRAEYPVWIDTMTRQEDDPYFRPEHGYVPYYGSYIFSGGVPIGQVHNHHSVLGIPADWEYFTVINAGTDYYDRDGLNIGSYQNPLANKFSSGVYIGKGKIVAIPSDETQPVLVDLGSEYHGNPELTETQLLSAWFNKY